MKKILFVVAGALLACMAPVAGSQADRQESAQIGGSIAKGRVVQFADGTTLKFGEKVVAKPKPQEAFVVLQVTTDSAFVSTADPAGREMAAKAPLTAAAAAQLSGPELNQLIVSLAKAGQYAAVDAILGATSSPELDASPVRSAAAATKASSEAYRVAEARLPAVKLEAARLRKAAVEAEVPSRLVPTMQEKLRGAALRRDAFELEKRAAAEVAEADQARKAAVTKLASALKVDPATSSAIAKYLNDPPSDPGVWGFKAKDTPPSYKDTIEFINAKLRATGQRLWFGKGTQRMILANEFKEVLLFNPAQASPTIKYATRERPNAYWVRVSTSSGKPEFRTLIPTKGAPEVRNNSEFDLVCADAFDAEKVAKAMRHLIEMFGGKEDLF